MRIVNMHEARTDFLRLVKMAAEGEPFVIARAGKPVVQVVALDTPDSHSRIGFLAGRILVPPDFDSMGAREIQAVFSVGK